MQNLLNNLYQEGQAFSWLEIIGVLSAIAYVSLAAKGNRWCFLYGLISSTIYIYLSLVLRFYFDTAINIYYIIMSFYGWFAWSKPTDKTFTPLWLGNRAFINWSILGVIATFSLAFIVNKYSSASLPYLDAFTTVFAIIATYMVIKKWTENWIVWVFVDTVAAGMYWYKDLYLTSLLFSAYTIISIFGYLKWKKLMS